MLIRTDEIRSRAEIHSMHRLDSPFNPKLANSAMQSMGRLKVGDATNMHPRTSSKRARHLGAVMLRPNSSTAKAAVEKIFNCYQILS